MARLVWILDWAHNRICIRRRCLIDKWLADYFLFFSIVETVRQNYGDLNSRIENATG